MNTPYENRTIQRMGLSATVEMGLRTYMQKVFTYMAIGLGITGAVAYTVGMNDALVHQLFKGPMMWLVMLAPLGMVFYLSFRINSMSFASAQMAFWIFSGLMGLSLSRIFMLFELGSITHVFFITASLFAGMALYGYTTKKDLTSMGSFMMMGLFGIVIASIVNIFMHSGAMQLMISVLAVIIFTGLTAYDTQKIKDIYLGSDSVEVAGKKSVMGALALYLDFINLFINLLYLFANRRD